MESQARILRLTGLSGPGWSGAAARFAVFVALYVASDWISNIDPQTPFGFTLWNPPAALALFLGLVWRWRALPAIAISAALSGIMIRGYALDLHSAWVTPAVLSFGYAALGNALASRRDAAAPFAEPMSALAFMLLAIFGAGAIAVLHVGVFAALGFLDPSLLLALSTRSWIGDATGIAVMLPVLVQFGAVRAEEGWRDIATADTFGAIAAAATLAGMAILGPGATTNLAYLVILPVVWVAVRRGLSATLATLFAIQCAIILFIVQDEAADTAFSEFQVLIVVVAMTGLILGTAVGHIRRSADDLARARAEGDRLARLTAVGALGSAIAHELSQPLFAIRTASHVLMRGLERDGGTGEMLRAARTIESQIEQASARIRALRAEFQSAGPMPSVFDLVVAARQAARIVDGGAAMARGQLTVEDSPPVRVRADRAHVAYILDNLFRNALAAIRVRGAGGRVRVVFGAADDIVRVEVVDNGVGISDDLAGRLFEPMVTGRHDGVGLGLFIGRTLAELNDGALSHRATNGGGATFVLELPAGANA